LFIQLSKLTQFPRPGQVFFRLYIGKGKPLWGLVEAFTAGSLRENPLAGRMDTVQRLGRLLRAEGMLPFEWTKYRKRGAMLDRECEVAHGFEKAAFKQGRDQNRYKSGDFRRGYWFHYVFMIDLVCLLC